MRCEGSSSNWLIYLNIEYSRICKQNCRASFVNFRFQIQGVGSLAFYRRRVISNHTNCFCDKNLKNSGFDCIHFNSYSNLFGFLVTCLSLNSQQRSFSDRSLALQTTDCVVLGRNRDNTKKKLIGFRNVSTPCI